MPTRQNTDYGYDIQKIYLEMMLADAETFVRCQAIFNSELFDRKLQPAAKFIYEYVAEFNTLPTYEMVNAATNSNLQKVDSLQEEHLDWMLVEFETFTRHKSLERAILDASDLLEQGNYGPVEDMIKQAVQIGLTKDLGTNYFDNPRDRLLKLKEKNGQIKTTWKSLDDKLYGGMNRGELEIFCGGSGAGKSLFLANLAVNWVLEGLHVVYMTFELSETLVSMRIDAMTTGISTKDIFKKIDDVDMKVRMIGKKSGTLQIKYLPSGKNTNDLRAYIKEYEIKLKNKVDVIIVDYLDLMMPINKKVNPSELFIKDKFVSEELRNLAMEKQILVVTASQFNRSSVDEFEFDHSHIAGGISKIQTADNVFGILTSKQLRDRGQYQLQLMKTRSSSGVGQKIDLEFDIDTLRISDSGDATAEEYTSKSSEILESIKRKTTVAKSIPVAATETTKTSTSDSTKLRKFINTISEEL